MTMFIALFTILSIPSYLSAQDCTLNLVPVEDAWDKKLHQNLWAHYDRNQPPSNQSCVSASVRIQLKSFILDEFEGIYTAKVWTRMTWIDKRLAWTPSDYGGVKKIIKLSGTLWRPAFKLIHGVYPPMYDDYFSDCAITDEGKVLCVGQVLYDTFCSSKLRNWPYDVQNCTLEFGDDDIYGITKFEFPDRAMSMFGAEYGPGWNIMDVQFKTNVSSAVLLSISLTLERQAYGLVVILIIPCIILSLLTFTSTLLSPKGVVRLGFSGFCLIGHFIFSSAINEFLPKHSTETPVILLFVQCSTILTITSILLTQVLRVMVVKTTSPPTWVASVTNEVEGSFGNYLLFPKWFDNLATEDLNNKNKEIWLIFANVINSIYIAILVVVYICLFRIYMPKQPTFEY
ncbi:acetylcholine receptor subunit alpha-like [Choristoneura fumiferana]|uniref:acetylcholine receptor subunit alpha-like n=1 Tax=Choristoneura fumiferana TaxID=7141 RepID=UPI003D156947